MWHRLPCPALRRNPMCTAHRIMLLDSGEIAFGCINPGHLNSVKTCLRLKRGFVMNYRCRCCCDALVIGLRDDGLVIGPRDD